jgi:hypothetical protein
MERGSYERGWCGRGWCGRGSCERAWGLCRARVAPLGADAPSPSHGRATHARSDACPVPKQESDTCRQLPLIPFLRVFPLPPPNPYDDNMHPSGGPTRRQGVSRFSWVAPPLHGPQGHPAFALPGWLDRLSAGSIGSRKRDIGLSCRLTRCILALEQCFILCTFRAASVGHEIQSQQAASKIQNRESSSLDECLLQISRISRNLHRSVR